MKNSIEIFKDLSDKCYQDCTYYTFNKLIEESEKYKKGRIDASKWVNEVLYIFMQKEKDLVNELKEVLENKRVELENLNDGNYREGLFDQLKEVREFLNK